MTRAFVFLLVSPLLMLAQDGAGLSSPWQLKKKLESLSEYCKRLSPIVDQLNPTQWREAPAGYLDQQRTIKVQLQSLGVVTQSLLKDPERLPIVLDLFFRYENFDLALGSLLEGVRRYQNPAVADLITGMRTENASLRQSLKEYLVELASVKDQEFRIADEEAQRCRTSILKKPVRR